MDLSYILNHLGEERASYAHAVVPPIYQTSNFAMPTVAAMREAFANEYDSHLYTRGNNPTNAILRAKLAALEGAEDALVFGSGAAAIAAAVSFGLAAGDHVVAVSKPYTWTKILLRDHLTRFGLSVSWVDMTDTAAVEAALSERTQLIVLESPNSLTFEQCDIAAITALARARGIRTVIDTTWATPLGQSPLSLGVDLVVHSGTKYLAGHSDVVFGVVAGSRELLKRIFFGPYMTLGAILSPHDAWLALRGLRTLSVRMERIARSATVIADWLATQPRVRRLYWPHHPEQPQFGLTQAQLRHASGLMSIDLDTDLDGVARFCDGLERFLLAVSWGGYESLAFPIAGVRDWRGREHEAGVPVTLVRLSIGLEDPAVLIDDLARAFARL